ncbi:hypothetical protein TanjilG_21499 [Lupinus angustifolius]|uniref:AB hydrolase-1 domain-containing protein n=1 Tax=Lupinus angustifolius TaxID=3871 RepID=A0A4P1QUM0_LUPAN|nr:PREDICTED: protein AUXIN RESPONSE 4 [Lupinus angustifolius]XP_019419780.1 PREDICTED: protein AUXIN RESPONSE 4 [Lupinus angustifolius]OIV95109.1 hypothetical protein TanjilG_21499 [Lupinus angustifolius]
MAIITEQDPKPQQQHQKQQQKTKPKSSTTTKTTTNDPFSFWFYFTLSISLITIFFTFFTSSLSSHDTKSWFLSLPTTLRHHYSNGRTVKVQLHPNQPPIQVFTFQQSPSTKASENVVVLHGYGLSSFSYRKVLNFMASKGLQVVAIDLPGNGFSEKSMEVVSVEPLNGFFDTFWYVYGEIKEKGVFWAFDQIVETGQIPYEEILARMSKRKIVKPVDLGPEDMGRVLGQVINTLGLEPVHLVLHDSALGLSANWISDNSEFVRSVTLIDTSNSGALPICVLEYPLIREAFLGFNFVYAKVLNSCCSKGVGVNDADADAQRVLLKGMDGRKAVVAIGKRLNSSFDVEEWGGSDGLKGMPMQLLWSKGWSKEWSDEGNRVARALPQASFVTHSGGRWAQEDAADEIAEKISNFIFSLPKSVRKVEQEAIPDHIQKLLDEAKNNDHDHHHGHGHDHHDDANIHEPDYMNAYGLGQSGHHHGW